MVKNTYFGINHQKGRSFIFQASYQKSTILLEFFKSEEQRKIYKLTVENRKVFLYWVSCWELEDGSFNHSRGRDRIESWEKGLEVCRAMCVPATRDEYVKMLRDFFVTDQKVAEQFYQAYGK